MRRGMEVAVRAMLGVRREENDAACAEASVERDLRLRGIVAGSFAEVPA